LHFSVAFNSKVENIAGSLMAFAGDFYYYWLYTEHGNLGPMPARQNKPIPKPKQAEDTEEQSFSHQYIKMMYQMQNV
jgi:hypothetical protein